MVNFKELKIENQIIILLTLSDLDIIPMKLRLDAKGKMTLKKVTLEE